MCWPELGGHFLDVSTCSGVCLTSWEVTQGRASMRSTDLGHPPQCCAWTVVTEVMLLAVCAFALKMILDRWGPGRMRGMASRGEAERLLGATRLRKVRCVVRPDLYGKRRRPS
jgi:hypothetical protein